MDMTKSVIQKVKDLLIWDDVTTSCQFFSVENRDSVVSPVVSGEKIPGQKTIYIIENKCEKAGMKEVQGIISELDWNTAVSLIFISRSVAEVKNVAQTISCSQQGRGEIYGIDPDYYFSLVPFNGINHKKIEGYIFSLESRIAFRSKIKFLIKRIMILCGFSESLYEKYVYCFYCNNS